MAGAADPLRADLRPEAVSRAARRRWSPPWSAARSPATGPDRSGTIAGAPGRRALARREPTPALVEAVDAALVLLADHELATSTMAVRVAASTRADLYDAVLAGLGTIAGPLHGGASQLAYAPAGRRRARRASSGRSTTPCAGSGVLPGFGHTVYSDGDPRFPVLLARFEALAAPGQRRAGGRPGGAGRRPRIPPPNVDLALAALRLAAGLPSDAGRTLFTVARVAGWVAHYLEELRRAPAALPGPGRLRRRPGRTGREPDPCPTRPLGPVRSGHDPPRPQPRPDRAS